MKQVTEKAHSGSYLLRYPDRMGAIVERVVAACAPTPVTAKIRLGCTRDNINAIDVAQVVEGAGAAALTVHGRTAADISSAARPTGTGSPQIKPHLEADSADRQRRSRFAAEGGRGVRRYDVDGVMIARAALGKPWLFRAGSRRAARRADPARPDARRRARAAAASLRAGRASDSATRRGRVLMRKFACCYAQGRPGAREFRTYVATIQSPRSSSTSSNATFHALRTTPFKRDRVYGVKNSSRDSSRGPGSTRPALLRFNPPEAITPSGHKEPTETIMIVQPPGVIDLTSQRSARTRWSANVNPQLPTLKRQFESAI